MHCQVILEAIRRWWKTHWTKSLGMRFVETR